MNDHSLKVCICTKTGNRYCLLDGLLPLKWEDDAAPYMGRHPQTTINKQMCDKSDLLIALFKTKLGTPTEQFESGTVEEINALFDKK